MGRREDGQDREKRWERRDYTPEWVGRAAGQQPALGPGTGSQRSSPTQAPPQAAVIRRSHCQTPPARGV